MASADDANALFRAATEAAIERDDPLELGPVAAGIGLDGPDREWAQSCCIQLSRHRSAEVRGNAIAAFGHLARRFGRLDPQRVRRIVEIALFDPSESVRALAASAAEDLGTFLGWDFEIPAR